MKTFSKSLFHTLVVAALAAPSAVLATSGDQYQVNMSVPKENTSCKVAPGGANAGKIGTYSRSKIDGQMFCQGSWGATACGKNYENCLSQVPPPPPTN